ncbi:uncharacterized protein LOC131194794 [Ahaetulla prasina]|uniref:uncharacterized protein LOC131194794 n=1 Tax=Ahaetulla prasina TaxID=499056 RepID=UPI002648EF04|nr:uncharacterized protein LOC131194794 [Ahaetulla prasina]
MPVASGSPLCIPSTSIDSQGNPQTLGREGKVKPSGSSLAQETMVRGSVGSVSHQTLEDPKRQDTTSTGNPVSPRTPVVSINRLEAERDILRQFHIPSEAIPTIQASHCSSTIRIYQTTWKSFVRWCRRHKVSPTQAEVPHIIGFLQGGLDSGLSSNTLRRQVAAISSVLTCTTSDSLAIHPVIRRFLRGASNLRSPTDHRYPPWDLNKVLSALTKQPFEPLREVSLRFLTLKICFLIAITSARRISELAALSIRKDLCIFHPDRVVLCLNPTFTPKINSLFHRSQELVLLNFCPNPSHQLETLWHTLDVHRAIKIYLQRTSAFRRSEVLFVSFLPASLGLKVSGPTIGRWIKSTIAAAYDVLLLPRFPILLPIQLEALQPLQPGLPRPPYKRSAGLPVGLLLHPSSVITNWMPTLHQTQHLAGGCYNG